jgi:hypothetical protein
LTDSPGEGFIQRFSIGGVLVALIIAEPLFTACHPGRLARREAERNRLKIGRRTRAWFWMPDREIKCLRELLAQGAGQLSKTCSVRWSLQALTQAVCVKPNGSYQSLHFPHHSVMTLLTNRSQEVADCSNADFARVFDPFLQSDQWRSGESRCDQRSHARGSRQKTPGPSARQCGIPSTGQRI